MVQGGLFLCAFLSCTARLSISCGRSSSSARLVRAFRQGGCTDALRVSANAGPVCRKQALRHVSVSLQAVFCACFVNQSGTISVVCCAKKTIFVKTKDRTMKKIYAILICLTTCLLFCRPVRAAEEMLDYMSLSAMSPKQLYEQAVKFKENNNKDTAMGYYIILAGKWRDDMSPSDKYFCTWACNELGKLWYEKGAYDKSFNFFMQGIKYGESTRGTEELLCKLYNNVGNVYCMFEDMNLGIGYYEKGLELARREGYVNEERITLKNLSVLCINAELREKAINYSHQLYDKFGKEDSTIAFYSYFNRGLMQLEDSLAADAAVSLKAASDYAVNRRLSPEYEASALGKLVSVYMDRLGDLDSALIYLRRYYDVVFQNNVAYMKTDALSMFAQYYEVAGNRAMSLQYKQRYWALTDSIFQRNQYTSLKNERFFYELDQNYGKIKKLTDEAAAKDRKLQVVRRRMAAIAVALVVFISLFVLIMMQKRKLKAAYKDLFERNSENLRVEQQCRERMAQLEKQLESAREKLRQGEEEKKEEEVQEQPDADDQHTTYQNGVSEEQRQRIVDGIYAVMDNAETFCDCDFDIDRLAELVNSNSRYVSQVINENFGKNFRTFINEYRIREAQRRLLNTGEYGNYTIKAIAESVGYKSYTSFNSLFKKATGITPAMYQQMAQEGAGGNS